MAVKLHHCSLTWARVPGHPCANVRSALDDAHIDYEIVKHPLFPRSKRTQLVELTGQDRLPAIQFDDGSILREESKAMVERIKAGKLFADRAI
jgi:glutathione S-transferase